MPPIFPFTAIVGQERMKRALILNAVDTIAEFPVYGKQYLTMALYFPHPHLSQLAAEHVEAVSKAVIANREERSGKQSQKIKNLSIKRLLRSFLPYNDVLCIPSNIKNL